MSTPMGLGYYSPAMKVSGRVLLLLAVTCAAQGSFGFAQDKPAPPLDPAAFPARDTHEGVTLAAKPHTQPADLAARFGKHPLQPAGILPIEVLVVNERSEAIRIAWERAVLYIEEDRFETIDGERAAWKVYPPPKTKPGKPWPGTPEKFPRDKKREVRENLQAALTSQQVRLAVIRAGSRARGFLYFDLGARRLDLSTARLYLPEVVRLPDEEPLIFFEVELKPYAQP